MAADDDDQTRSADARSGTTRQPRARQATDLTDKISAAETQQAQLEAQIAQAELDAPALQARADVLRVAVKERAVQLYVGHDQRIDAVLQTDERRRRCACRSLTGSIADHDRDVAAELKTTARQIEAQEDQLRVQRAALQQTIDSYAPLQDLLQKRLGGRERGVRQGEAS